MLQEVGSIKSNPASKLERMTLRSANLNVPEKEDFRRIIEEVKKAPILRKWQKKGLYSEAADMIAFLAYSGLRIEEARRLVWGDIGKESISVPDIKHATSRRTLYINASLAEVIESLRRERRGNSPDDPVFAIETPERPLQTRVSGLDCLTSGFTIYDISSPRPALRQALIFLRWLNGWGIVTAEHWL